MSEPDVWKRPAGEITDDLRERVRQKFGGNGCFVLEEVRDAGGFNASRSIDLLAMETWPSKGYTTRGFEVKATRADWLRERADPSKAESFAAMVDEFWVASPPGVALPEELPTGYGLLHGLGESKLKVVRQAVTRVGDRGPIDRAFVAAMLVRSVDAFAWERSQAKTRDAKRTAALIREARETEREHYAKLLESRRDEARREYEQLTRSVAAFEEASGIKIGCYDGAQIGDVVRQVRDGGHLNIARRINITVRQLQELLAAAERCASDLAAPVVSEPADV